MSKTHTLFDKYPYPLIVDISDPSNFEIQFDAELLRLAKALRLCAQTDTLGSLRATIAELSDEHLFSQPVRGQALRFFYVSAIFVDESKERFLDGSEDYLVFAAAAAHWFAECHGYFLAMRDQSHEAVRRGAAGRRILGATTREKVRKEALRVMRPGLSKEGAAPEIAQLVNLSSGTVRKMLSKIFPGDSWTKV